MQGAIENAVTKKSEIGRAANCGWTGALQAPTLGILLQKWIHANAR
jgi:hypothetical protein